MTERSYEDLIDSLESDSPSKEALEAGADAMSFVQGLHNMFVDNRMTVSEQPDLNELENLIDALHGELAAACIFLSEVSFSSAPDMLRATSKQLEKLDKEGAVPTVIKLGYKRLAERIEKTRYQLTKTLDNQNPL